MLTHLRPPSSCSSLLTLLTGLAYPLAITGIAPAGCSRSGQWQPVVADGKVVGSELIGQNWTSDRYFHGRPSAAGNGYDAMASSGSNLGPTSAKLMDAREGGCRMRCKSRRRSGHSGRCGDGLGQRP